MSEEKHETLLGRRDVIVAGVTGAGVMAMSAAPVSAEEKMTNISEPGKSPEWPENRIASCGMAIKTDYDALREKRMAELSEEVRTLYQVTNGLSLKDIGIGKVREMMKRPERAILPEGVEAYTIEIPGPAGPIPTRIYRPKDAKGKLGVYLHTHSGGWTFNNGLTHVDAENGKTALDWGCMVVHPDFRVAPENNFPAPIEDCYAVFNHIAENAASLGMDKTRIGIGGGCTGGNIATVVSLMARDAGGVKPAVQFLWSTTFDLRNDYESSYECAKGYGLTLETADYVNSLYLRTREDCYDWRASPILAETLKNSSPTIIWVGEYEILRSESQAYAGRLRDAGVPVHLIVGEQQGHGFLYFPNLKTGQPTEYQKKALPEVNKLMRSYIGPESARKKS